MSHFTEKIISIKKNKNHDAIKLANDIIQNLEFDCFVMSNGFRFEFNGIPVISRNTGETFSGYGGYWSEGKHSVMEYCIIRDKGDVFELQDYYGPAGRNWSGEFREKLIKAFEMLA